jgi:homoserine kinase
MEAIATAGRRAGALGCVLSGAGPSMLAAVRQGDGRAVAEAMERALRDAGIAGRAMVLPVDPVGATWERVSET